MIAPLDTPERTTTPYLRFIEALDAAGFRGDIAPDYDYEKHFGGVYYLFIKGMKKELGSANGIFRDRPSLKLINKLDETFRGGLS